MAYLSNKIGDPLNLGWFATPLALQTAYPVGADGYFAIVGSTDSVWTWDSTTSSWVDTQRPISTGVVASIIAGSGISVNSTDPVNPIVTNTLPDRVVVINAGTNITSVTGTYPNFTINAATQTYTLPIASTSVLGGIKVGSGLSIDGTGVLSATTGGSGTVTSVAAITLGTTGTDLSSTVVNSTTTPVITLNVPTASATNRGVLSPTDWSTFNNKQPAGNYWTDSSTNTGTNKTLSDLSNYIEANAIHAKVFLNLGRDGVIGDALYVSNWNIANSCPEVSLARANSITTLPCAGVLETAGADGSVQHMRISGILNNVNTNSFSSGTRLYVSATTAGALTSTRPTTPNFDQAIATVSFQNATTGVLNIIETAYVGTMAYADTASYQTVLTNPVTGTGTTNELSYWTGTNSQGTLPVATYPSLTELTYLKGATSSIQTQLGTKAATLSGTINQIAYFNSASTISSLTVATYPSLTELTYLKGVTSSIQTQFTGKASTSQTFFLGTTSIAINRSSAAIALTGITSIDGTATNLSGTPALPNGTTATTQSANDNSTKIATTAYADLHLEKTGGTLTGKVTTAGNDEVGKTYTPASGAQTVALDCVLNNVHVVSGNASGTAITFTVANATNSQPFIVSILQGGTTVSTITAWFATIRWAGGTAPTLTATLNKRDTFGFIRTGVNTYDGFIIGQNC